MKENQNFIKFTAGALVAVELTTFGVGVEASTVQKNDMVVGSAITSKTSEDVNDKYKVALKNLGVVTEKESTSENQNKKIIVQVDQPYYVVSNPLVDGENNILKKTDTCPEIIEGRVMVPARLISENLGAKVDWDEDSKTITISKDKTIVNLKLGSNLMTVNNDNQIKEVTLDVPAQINKDGRTVIPVRAVSESLGVLVSWDESKKMVLIGYSSEEAVVLESKNNIDLNSNFKAFEFMAGGEFADCVDMGPFAIRDEKSGAVVAFSEQDSLGVDEKYMDASVVGKVRDKLKDGDFVWVMGGEAYVFNKDFYSTLQIYNNDSHKIDTITDKNNNYINRINENGNVQKIEREDGFYYFKPQVCWDRDLGVCLSNGLIITDKFNPATNKFEELNTYVELGTPEQTIRKKLDKLVNNVGTGLAFDKTPLNNSMSLDKSEVQKYMETGDDQGFKSFEIIKDADGKPRIVLVKSECGFDDLNVKVLRDSFKLLNKIDPDYLRKQSTTDCLTVDCYPGDFWGTDSSFNYSSTYRIFDYGSIMIFPNEMKPEYMNVYDSVVVAKIESFVAEDRGLRDEVKEKWVNDKLELVSIGKLDKLPGMDKSLFVKNKIEDWKKNGKITEEQYRILMIGAQGALDYYTKSQN